MAYNTPTWNEEFGVLKQMQEDRMNFFKSMTCHERCVSHYWFNDFYGAEYKCMRNCLEKLNQVSVITNINFNKYEQEKAERKRK
ncbi:hypothetical protein TRSC58_06116 [Trypanosoma rangeli SC58]|uniref:Mitochondrial translocase subunit n=1 Tax=Trypanosoma rangeli SC58 TaxID=429131 RepID=A0A061IYV5_TRYRA|nr:hypothetical protein TRSC58_06116 [Trypanosoma rangeli SC58]